MSPKQSEDVESIVPGDEDYPRRETDEELDDYARRVGDLANPPANADRRRPPKREEVPAARSR